MYYIIYENKLKCEIFYNPYNSRYKLELMKYKLTVERFMFDSCTTVSADKIWQTLPLSVPLCRVFTCESKQKLLNLNW